jgi:hypothetical protein
MRMLLPAAAAAVALALPAKAAADMTTLDPVEPGSPAVAAQALLADPSDLIGAVLDEYAFDLEIEPSPLGVGNATITTDPPHQLVGFPTAGETYTVLSSGDVNTIGGVFTNDFSDTSFAFSEQAQLPVPPGADRDLGANDWTVLQIGVDVPSSANCLSLDYRFISEEFPEFVGSIFNDAFFAEIDSTSWSVTDEGVLTRPNDLSVNGVGDTAVLDSEAAGTYFDAATGLVTTKTPITPGAHTIFLSIFDAGDDIYDSAVFLDDLRFIAESPATCQPPTGQQIAPPPPPAPNVPPPPPSNKFQPGPSVVFGKAKTSATLTVVVPGPGVLTAGSTTVGAARANADSSAARIRRATAARPQEVAASAAKKKPKGKKKKGKKKAKPKVKKPLLNSSTVRANQAGPVQITVSLSGTGKAVLAKKGKLTIPVTLTFTPDGGAPASQVQTVTFKKAKPKKCAKPKGKAKGKAKASAKGGKQCKKPAKKGKGKKK